MGQETSGKVRVLNTGSGRTGRVPLAWRAEHPQSVESEKAPKLWLGGVATHPARTEVGQVGLGERWPGLGGIDFQSPRGAFSPQMDAGWGSRDEIAALTLTFSERSNNSLLSNKTLLLIEC